MIYSLYTKVIDKPKGRLIKWIPSYQLLVKIRLLMASDDGEGTCQTPKRSDLF